MDRLQGMEVFVRVADLGSFSAAADQLGLSKSAVSKHVTALEDRLGVRLINRTTRRIALTELGQAYRDCCARIVAEVEEAELSTISLGIEPRGTLKINAPMSFGFLHLAPVLATFGEAYPRIEVDLTLNDRRVDLIEEGVDVAIRIGHLPDSRLIARKLATCHRLVCASPAYLDAHGSPAAPADLDGHNCLRYTLAERPDLWPFAAAGRDQSVRVGGTLRSNNGDAIRAAVVAGLGIGLLPSFIVADDLRTGRLVRLLDGWRAPGLTVHAVYPHHRHVSAKLRALVGFLADRFQPVSPWADVEAV